MSERLQTAPLRPYLAGALASYLLAYFYMREVVLYHGFAGWGLPVFALLFLLWVELLARPLHRAAAPEAPLWAACWLTLSAGMWAFGQQPVLWGWQMLAWHLFAVW